MVDNNKDIKDVICDFDNLHKAMMKCRKGVMWKDSVARHVNNGLASILKLQNDLESGKYKIDDYYRFTIHEPKEREIVSNRFKDRVFQRSMVDNYLYEAITKGFIYDNCACQVGKGTDFARNRLKCHMQRFFRKYGLDGYVLKCDIKNYFGSTSHKKSLSFLKRYVDDPWVYAHLEAIFDSYSDKDNPGVGFGLGSQINQLTQLLFLSELDHNIKEKLRVKQYARYMDDFPLIHHDKAHLKHCREEIEGYLNSLGLKLNEKKTQMFPLKQGIDYLGFKFKLTDTGKVLMLLSKENVKKRKRKLRGHKKLVDEGRMTREKADQCYESWKAHAAKGNSYNLIKRMDAYYASLWEE
ncbi:MAG: RNA-directed DNA polymerase [Firmicutes bacterium]|nr:RNA-directed DNA polymerase [Bacillota bacterium]